MRQSFSKSLLGLNQRRAIYPNLIPRARFIWDVLLPWRSGNPFPIRITKQVFIATFCYNNSIHQHNTNFESNVDLQLQVYFHKYRKP